MHFTLPVSILTLLTLTSALPQPNHPPSSSSVSLSQPPSALHLRHNPDAPSALLSDPPNALLHPRQEPAPTAGPIPIQHPVRGWPASSSVTRNARAGGLQQSAEEMEACLVKYSTDAWYDGLDGMECGGMGWFKGGNLGGRECYEVCATYLLYDGIKQGQSDYQCDFRRGMKGHCWMGYHPL